MSRPRYPASRASRHRVLQPPDHVQHLAADVDERQLAPDRVRRDDHALDQRVRARHHQRDVLAGARLGLVRVQRQVVRLAVTLRDERPLLPGREARPAAAPQPGVLDLGDDLVRRHAQRRGQRPVTARPPVARQREAIRLIPVRAQHRRQGVGHVDASLAGASADPWFASWPSPGDGAAQPCSLAIFSPSRSGGPAAGPSVGLAIREAGQDPARLPPGAQVAGAAGRRDLVARPQVVNEPAGRAGGHVVEELPVDHHHRRVDAGRVALDPLNRDLAVRGRLVVAHAQVLGQRGEDRVAAHHRAQRVRAHAHVVVADRAPLEHGVKASRPRSPRPR